MTRHSCLDWLRAVHEDRVDDLDLEPDDLDLEPGELERHRQLRALESMGFARLEDGRHCLTPEGLNILKAVDG